ncbi:Spo0E family sporulation regulatory protein-aspartic acid phosphatase [Paenibacillus chitinolyticus]|uniref:Aspartyl-phosphate phosphatase Spo0E family protein n=2 Tax=Paenibacillus TaxID=44249 RepID=A0A410X2L6_9BACL|nr:MULTISPECIES: aspartyl-phosphate phosphatase Spo0E family protein [Paenibacillus]EPD89667.1 hypothetical protein HMPREF1207_01516 [Paenibacillus sp. HGH0039]MBV6712155.1 aspartyl-phosphate phosphatase Spo0E family protein [Paenibacillus chitinolyticus]MCY9591395.1 aspartyl-phosphate phosphatase Spo0E family protein [Paenibacillus chitinolyticus]MCY9599384.1 aspartyl-phosphate phosphatase Spo0E family protein [Paenibacillus chitinolyticus]MEC0247571.1 aspartyl-phosphate phosphatase Spo0E fam
MQQSEEWECRQKLDVRIEQLRSQMVENGMKYGFLHPSVQHDSRRLDKLILRYYQLERGESPLETKLE